MDQMHEAMKLDDPLPQELRRRDDAVDEVGQQSCGLQPEPLLDVAEEHDAHAVPPADQGERPVLTREAADDPVGTHRAHGPRDVAHGLGVGSAFEAAGES